MKKQLTEAEAWREIARRIAEGNWDGTGLCCEISDLYEEDAIGYATYLQMKRAINEQVDYLWAEDAGSETTEWPYLFPPGDDDERILLALLFAESCE